MTEKFANEIDIRQESLSLIRTAQRIQKTAELLRKWAKHLELQEASILTRKLNAERVIQRRLEAVLRKERQVQKALKIFRACTDTVQEDKKVEHEEEEEIAKYLRDLGPKKTTRAALRPKNSASKIQFPSRPPSTKVSWLGSFLPWRSTKQMVVTEIVQPKEIEVTSALRPQNKRKDRLEEAAEGADIHQELNRATEKGPPHPPLPVNTAPKKKSRRSSKALSSKGDKENTQRRVSSTSSVMESGNSA